MKKLYNFTLVLAFMFSAMSFAQQEKKLLKATKKFDNYSFIDAQKILVNVAQEGFRSKDLFQKLGDSYYFIADYANATRWYGELMADHANEVKPEYYFRYAQSLKSVERYSDSDNMMKKFNTFSGGDSRAKRFRNNPQYLMAIDFQAGRYKVHNIKANSSHSDFGPIFFGEELVFSSARDTGRFVKRIYEWTGAPFLELYKGKIDEETNEVEDVEKLNTKLNTRYHESSPAFTSDLKKVYFTRNNYNSGKYKTDRKGTNKLKIYTSDVTESGRWHSPKPIRFNNDEYSVAHPALSADNKKLYFSSDMPGGLGQSDIYEADINEDGTLGDPRNLGPGVNTEGRDCFPFMSKSGDLYFASDGHIGLGGLDLFVTKIKPNGKTAPVINLAEPVNSPKDDFGFIINEDTNVGYFSSNRPGGKGDDDIYMFKQLEGIRRKCNIVLEGIVTDIDTGELLENATVSLVNADNTVLETITTDATAKYSFPLIDCDESYFIRAEKDSYFSEEQFLTTPSESETINTPMKLEQKIKRATIGQDLGKILSLNPIYFDYDKSNIREDAVVELAKVIAAMKAYPEMKIDVRSHTDSRGRDSYNLSLSDRRAKSTVAYIISKGIAADRISGKGYGETQLINGCANGVDCTVEKHQLNRRSEFIILKF